MKLHQIAAVLLFAPFASLCQDGRLEKNDTIYGEYITDEYILSADQMPQFPGGDKGLKKFLDSTTKYPSDAKERGIEGRVIIRFIIDTLGRVTNPEVIRGLYKSCDREALRVISTMPLWKPAIKRGRKVRHYMAIPIKF